MARTPRDVHVRLELAPTAAPLRHRIAGAVVAALREGGLAPGDALPPSRTLAADLGVSRAAVVDAYDELAAAGFVVARAGSGTRVAAGADRAARAGVEPHVLPPTSVAAPAAASRPAPGIDLSPGYPDTELVSTRDWRSAWRSAAAAPVPPGVPGPDGHAELRHALAMHLRRTRGIAAAPDELVIVPGVGSALRTLVTASGAAGRTIAFEDPGYPKARWALESGGARVRPEAVDADGLDPARVRASDAAVYCTPAHQYPMGCRLPASRRAVLVAEARAAGRLVIEDDYDGEFRYGVAPLPALRSVAGGRDCVAYVGTASKIVSPGLRLAWIVPPPALVQPIHAALRESGDSACAVTSAALARFVDSGALTRHLARAARTYAARRHAFVAALRRYLPDVRLTGVDAGLHVALQLPEGTDDVAVAAEIARRGVRVPPLARYRATEPGPRGLLCGYARLPESKADAAARTIADVIRERAGAAADTWGSCRTSGS
ncbi:MocR-like pyridoxine biosynthesis transcription factor PdxR [Rhodococcus sp. SGAir0479]|uniref:MocR-like pyridoxine biosynthesis transcription factor PdxR n=1 Tax=Rhodococcus sp. SGAir0479 TaxID=2567884 RepID=UPI0010CD09C0|nr:PLP-dependent aminotransferase family protein [Rhodococcus sp. SGAir0479]QCQ91814.1 PLP-dependent aminotransferase family protein [Rhodococcus sp. SGAir0479]